LEINVLPKAAWLLAQLLTICIKKSPSLIISSITELSELVFLNGGYTDEFTHFF